MGAFYSVCLSSSLVIICGFVPQVRACDFPGKVTSQEIWLLCRADFPKKVDIPVNWTSWKSWLPGKFNFPVKLTPGKSHFPERKCDIWISWIYGFHGFMNLTDFWISRIFWLCWCLPEKCDFPEQNMWLLRRKLTEVFSVLWNLST